MLARSGRLWFAFAVAVLLTAGLGPFGTFERTTFAERLADSVIVHMVAWMAGIVLAVPTRLLARDKGASPVLARVIGTLAAGIAATPAFILTINLLNGGAFFDDPFVPLMLTMLPVGLGVAVLVTGWVDLRDQATVEEALVSDGSPVFGLVSDPQDTQVRALVEPRNAEVVEQALPENASPDNHAILDDLAEDNRGRLVSITAQDHYVLVETDRGSQLLLMRMADAVARTNPQTSMRVHRSAWVSFDAVEGWTRDGRAMRLRLLNGRHVPVSRANEAEVRQRFERL